MKQQLTRNAFAGKGKTVMTFSVACMALLTCLLCIVPGCKRNDTGASSVQISLSMVANDLVSPVTIVQPEGDSKRIFIVDQVGKVWIVKDGVKLSQPFIDISNKLVSLNPQYDERGLLGLAFHPSFKTNGRFYLFYTAPPRPGGPDPDHGWNSLTRVCEYRVSTSNPDMADAGTEKLILEADHPQSNHNGGTIAFGPDGYLYISIGDGGNKDDKGAGHLEDWYKVNVGGNAQNIEANWLGKILRIDVDNGNPYSIPADNPFAGTSAKQEIFAFGFRNPYRFSFDIQADHKLYAGDAGQSLYEEIDVVTKGGNYGWNVKEGSVCFNADSDKLVRESCPAADSAGRPLIDPVIQLTNAANPNGQGITVVVVAGHVYRGTSIPQCMGRYIFGSYSADGKAPNGKIYVTTPSGAGSWNYEELSIPDYPKNLGMFLKGFGQDQSGEIYVATSSEAGARGTTGRVYKLVGR